MNDVLFSFSEIWAQDPKSATNGISMAILCPNDRRTKFDITVSAEQHVSALNITMNDSVSVQVLETLARFPRNGGDLTLSHQVTFNHIRQASALHVLHDEP